jgi:hypothetical protein
VTTSLHEHDDFDGHGGYAACRALDGGIEVEARYWLDAVIPCGRRGPASCSGATRKSGGLDPDAVRPVARSEGIRMASWVDAGRGRPRGGLSVEALLAAGALLPAAIQAGGRADGAPTEPVRVRRYRHPALGDRVVARLTGDSVAPGEDRALAFLGFGPPEAGAPVAVALRRGLDFPAWALVNDPEHARAALAVVPEMEHAARLARTRPGAAKALYEELAVGRIRHAHLPSFWERAGRALSDAGHRTHAALMFERAREAERVYALDVDEAARREAFGEFAFAGALSVKSIRAYADDLRRRLPPAEAYEAFHRLALGRTVGGLPPWVGLPDQLRRLAGAAGLDQAAEEERLLERLLPLPATRSAPAGFWRRHRAALVRLAGRSPAARGLLLNLFPEPGKWGHGFNGWWLRLLGDAGALDALTRPAAEIPVAAGPAHGAAAWLSRAIWHARRGWRPGPPAAELLALVPRLAGRLRADGDPVQVVLTHQYRTELDLQVTDACLEHGIPVAGPGPAYTADLTAWLATGEEAEARRDLRFAAADPRFRRLLNRAIPGTASQGGGIGKLLDLPGLGPAALAWVEATSAAVGAGGLVQATSSLDALAREAGRSGMARLPGAQARLAGTDLAGPLARTLRGGLVDELAWPALDEALGELACGAEPRWSACWPVLVVHDRARAIAVGPEGRLATHELRIAKPPPSRDHYYVWYAGGQFLVGWHDGPDERAYWSGNPREVFTPTPPLPSRYTREQGWLTLLADGGLVGSGRALYPGDRAAPRPGRVFSDGVRLWRLRRAQGDRWQPLWQLKEFLEEFDPCTGEPGPRSLPRFLEEAAAGSGRRLVLGASFLAPAPPGTGGTPLGERDGLVGFRVTADSIEDPSRVRVEGVDGRSHDGPLPDGLDPPYWSVHTGPLALVAFPGAGTTPRLLGGEGFVWLWDPGLGGPLACVSAGPAPLGDGVGGWRAVLPAAGTPFGVPAPFWHFMRARDERGSRALRDVTEAQARELFQAAVADLEERASVGVDGLRRTASVVERALPDLTHPALRRGVVGVAGAAARLNLRRKALTERARPPSPRPAPAPPASRELSELRLALKLAGLVPEHCRPDGPGADVGAQLRALGRLFDAAGVDAGADDDQAARAAEAAALPIVLPWPELLGRIGAVAFRAATPAAGPGDRDVLLALLERWAGLPFSSDPGSFRTGAVKGVRPGAGRSRLGAWAVLATPAAGQVGGWREEQRAFVERTTGDDPGASSLPPDATIVERRHAGAGWGGPGQLRSFIALLRARGPVGWDPAVPEALAARTGLARAEAALLWAGLPDLDAREDRFLGPALRTMLGLKAADALAARRSLARLSMAQRLELLHAAMPDDPAGLWSPLGAGPDDDASPVAHMAAAWVERFGRLRAIPDDALSQAERLGRPTAAVTLLRRVLDPGGEPVLAHDHDCQVDVEDGPYNWPAVRFRCRSDQDPCRDGTRHRMGEIFADLAVAVPWLATSRPVGDPLLASLPGSLALARARLGHPGLILRGPTVDRRPGAEDLMRRLFGATPYRDAGGVMASADDGLTIAVVPHSHHLWTFFRPARLGDDVRSRALRALPPASWRVDLVAVATALRSDGYTALAERARSTPVPPGGYEANPAMSTPGTVGEVAAALGLDADAAALYLQLLTLLEPTDRNVRRWNGWAPARHRGAVAALAAAGLVVQAERARAGRRAFVPGAWAPAAAPNLPLEVWKFPLYGLERDRRTGRPLGRWARLLPDRPLHELFAAAWARVRAGDIPGEGA